MQDATLSERQKQILHAIIEEFVDSAEQIGSENLVEKYEFEFSPATMRNEMVELTKKGYLQKDHVSAGRTPTPIAFRYYVKNLMHEKGVPVVNEVSMKQRLWDNRHDVNQLLRQSSQALSEELQNLCFIITDENMVYSAGSAHILRHPEFYDIDVTRTVLHLLDQEDVIYSILDQLSDDMDIGILLGEEMGIPSISTCGIVAGKIDLPQNRHGFVAVVGPYRLNYQSVIPTMRYVQNLLNDLSRNW